MTKQRVLYYDVLNICACLCVVFLHFNGLVHSYESGPNWPQSLIIEVLCYWAVPIFFMLSGATLMNYRERYSTRDFLKRRFTRTVIPFLFWSLSIIVLKVVLGNVDLSGWTFYTWVDYVMNAKVEPVYWFFIPLFSIYLCMPVLSFLTEDKHRKTLWYAVTLSGLLYGTLPIISLSIGFPWNSGLNIPVLGGYLIFVVLGYLLSTTDIPKRYRICLYVLGVFSALMRYVFTYRQSIIEGQTVRTYFDYLQFHSIFLAVGVFVLFKQIPWEKIFKTDKSQRVIAKISSCSFGIYLIHMLLQRVCKYVLNVPENGLVWRLILPIFVYLVGLLIVYVMKNIPIIKRIVP